jgi:hypothetical protein
MYALDRVQGTLRDGSRVTISKHADVRRMLMLMKSATQAMRALTYVAASESDRLLAANDPGKKAIHQTRLDLYTPIVKGWITELAQEITSLGVQIHGGMGFIEETGAAQHYRDARILTIYEGTTGIQGLDLVGRKILGDDAVAINALLDDIAEELDGLTVQNDLRGSLQQAKEAQVLAREAVNWLRANPSQAPAVGVNLMMLLGYLCGGWLMLKGAEKAQALLGDASSDQAFLASKQVCARFYCEHYLPRVAMHLAVLTAGSESILGLDEAQF